MAVLPAQMKSFVPLKRPPPVSSAHEGKQARLRTSRSAAALADTRIGAGVVILNTGPSGQLVLEGHRASSYLESIAIGKPAMETYRASLSEFIAWCRRLNLDWSSLAGLDHLLVTFMDELFFRGKASSEGSKLLAAVKHFIPTVSRFGTESLPRSARATKSWIKAAPGMQRLPLPLVLLCAMMGHMLFFRRFWTAVKVFVQFRTYMRPGICDSLKVFQLVPPSAAAGGHYARWGFLLNPVELGVPGKTGLWDQAVVWDTELWMSAIFEQLHHQPQRASLWPVNALETIDHFNEAVEALGLTNLHPTRYSLRHGGASDDILSKRRSIEAVKIRGHWKADTSLRRYGKETRVLAELRKAAPQVIEYGAEVLNDLEQLLVSRKPPRAPPVVGRLAGG